MDEGSVFAVFDEDGQVDEAEKCVKFVEYGDEGDEFF